MKKIATYIFIVTGLIFVNSDILFAQYKGSGADGYGLVNSLAFCSPAAVPTPYNSAMAGGNGDGYGLVNNLTYCTTASVPAPYNNPVLGGTADGYGLVNNLTYCTPSAVPTPYNSPVTGGNADGYGLINNLSFCTPAAEPAPYNRVIVGGNADGYGFVDVLNLCTVTALPPLTYFTNQFDIAPNPASNYLAFRPVSAYTNEAVTVSVMNMLGEKMMEEKIVLRDYNVISTINLPAGMYFIKVENVSNASALPLVGKFIKE